MQEAKIVHQVLPLIVVHANSVVDWLEGDGLRRALDWLRCDHHPFVEMGSHDAALSERAGCHVADHS